LVLGWHLDIVEASSKPLKGIEKTYDFCSMVPIQLNNSIDQLHLIKKLIVGGGEVSKGLQQKIELLKTDIFATYGMTETITHIAVKKLNNFSNVTLSASTTLSTGSVERSNYSILQNIRISKDNKGCLVIDAPKISDNQIITNDLVEIISESEFRWLGRYDNIINSGGVKLSPELIEEKLEALIKGRFFIASIPDTILGERLIIIIESENIEQNLMNRVKELKTLSKFEIPKKMYVVPAFVETETKKINRKKTLANLNLL
jgi:O-succinylbenzoic acid--CoA ligase